MFVAGASSLSQAKAGFCIKSGALTTSKYAMRPKNGMKHTHMARKKMLHSGSSGSGGTAAAAAASQ